MTSTAAKVTAEKADHPERFCLVRRCLWRIKDREGNPTPCQKHPNVIDLMQALRDSLKRNGTA